MKTTELKKGFQDGKYEELLRDIYIDESVLDYQKERYIKAIESFEELFGEKEVEIYSAPGRSESGGNHTDHQLGRVLAASINLDAIAIVAKKENGVVLKSEGYPMINVSLADLLPKKEEEGTSAGLIRGVAAKLKEEGYEIGGFEAYVTSDVLNGAGMSSSAAFEVLIGNILSGLYNEGKVSPVLIAQAGQYAENVFFGKKSGLMDQMISSVGGLVFIDFHDTENPKLKSFSYDFDKSGYCLCITDTKGSHADLTDDYVAIRTEMESIAAQFGKKYLGDVNEKDFYNAVPELRKKCSDRAVMRAAHFFEENKRALLEAETLITGNINRFLELVRQSGESSANYLQNLYSCSQPTEQAIPIGIMLSKRILGNNGAVRVHGGGFAGTIQAFVPVEKVNEYVQEIDRIFGDGSCYILKIRSVGGIEITEEEV